MTTWRTVPGWEDYEVSSEGQVNSLPRCNRTGRKGGQRLRWCFDRGYPFVWMSSKGKAKRAAVHRLVALAFLGPRPEGMEVCHVDGDAGNPAVSNLRYGTRSSNARDKVAHGRQPDYRGEKSPSAKLTGEMVRMIRMIRASAANNAHLAEELGVTQATICDIRKRRTWRHI